MTDKSSLLNELRIDRSNPAPTGPGLPWRWVIGALLLLIAAAAAWIAFAGPKGVPVKSAVARAASVGGAASASSMLDASGYVVARRQATVSSKVTGKVMEVLIEEGQRVEKDQVLARLDDSNAVAALRFATAQAQQAEAALAAARVALADAEPIYKRNLGLVGKGWISQTDYDNSRAAYDAAASGLEVASRALEVAHANRVVAQRALDDTVVRAPFAGVITVKAAQPGEMVSPISAGGGFTRTGIGTIVDMESIEVEVDVSENFISRVHAGQPATITLNAYPDWAIPGELIAVIPTADRAKATVKVRVGFRDKDPRILPQMGARVSFLGDAVPAAGGRAASPGVVVPADAVQAQGDTGVVFVIHEDKLERRAVRLGGKSGADQAIVAGLVAGEQVAIGDFSQFSDGARARVQ
jgi:RND family efflux transporter MFP subunit